MCMTGSKRRLTQLLALVAHAHGLGPAAVERVAAGEHYPGRRLGLHRAACARLQHRQHASANALPTDGDAALHHVDRQFLGVWHSHRLPGLEDHLDVQGLALRRDR
mgnify:CR=1 FL=1